MKQGLECIPSTHKRGSDGVGKKTMVRQAAECLVETVEGKGSGSR